MNKVIISEAGEFVILSSNEPYKNLLNVTSIIEEYTTESISIEKQFRWSSDNLTFSNWIELSLINLNNSLPFGEDSQFWIQFKLELLEDGSTEIEYFQLKGSYHNTTLDYAYPFPLAYGRDSERNYYPDKSFNFKWNPYNFQKAIKLHKDLSYIVNQMHGIDVQYYKADPQLRSKNIVLMEWGLLKYREPCDFKIVVPRNTFPDNKFNFGPFGQELEVPFEIHIDKRYFENQFGNGTGPQKSDAIYIPMNDRMYIVESSTLQKTFMNESIFWKVNLKKHTRNISVIENESVKVNIDELTTGLEDMFKEDNLELQLDIVNPQQLKDKTIVSDPIREYINNMNSFIVQYNLDNYNNTISQYYYDMNSAFTALESLYEPSVRYKYINSFKTTENRVYTSWFNINNISSINRNVTNVQFIDDNEIRFDFQYKIPNVQENQILIIKDKTKSDFLIYGTVKTLYNGSVNKYVTITCDTSILEYANSVNANWVDSTDLIGELGYRRNLLYGYDEEENKGLQIDIFNNNFLRIVRNDVYDLIPIEFDYNKWYGIVINILNEYGQLSVNLYERKNVSERSNKLNEVFEYSVNNIDKLDLSSNTKFQLLSSPIRITNIRFLSEQLEKEKHNVFLNMNVIKDGSKALIIDNAIPRLNNPYIGVVK